MLQPTQETNLGHPGQWTTQRRIQVKLLLERLGAATTSAALGSAKARGQCLAELGRQVRAWRSAVGPLLNTMRVARARRRVRSWIQRAGVLKELSVRVRQVRQEAGEAIKRFDVALETAASQSRSTRDRQIASIAGSVRSLRAELRQFLADLRGAQRKQNAAARSQRAGFVQRLKHAEPVGTLGPQAGVGCPVQRPAATRAKLAAHRTIAAAPKRGDASPSSASRQPGFVQEILDRMQPRKIA